MDEPEIDETEDKEAVALTSADFHTVAQKQIMNAVFAALAEAKMDWALIAPFMETAREVCAGDFQENGRIRLHTLRAEGETWVEAEEAFLGISVADRDEGEEWLSETYWLSDIATANGDPEQVKAIVAALERTIAKLNNWLANPPGDAGEAAPPVDQGPA